MTGSESPQSIYNLAPLESGGVEARRGFGIQDDVGVKYCLDLLQAPDLKEVWVETHDDFTLIWDHDGNDEVEFVQVKGAELDQLWSVAKLCERKRDLAGSMISGTSILERSFAHDRCCEPCRFRIVTVRPVQDKLKCLTHELASRGRILSQADIDSLIDEVGEKVGDFKSKNNNGHKYWISHTLWEVIHSSESIKSANMVGLAKIVETKGCYLLIDQHEELYEAILARISAAASLRWEDDAEKKKLRKDDFGAWFDDRLKRMANPPVVGGGRMVKVKMAGAQIPNDAIETAKEQRRRYLAEKLQPQYLMTRDMGLIDGEVRAVLHDLRGQLDAGVIADSGVEFHARCLQGLDELRGRLPISPAPPLDFLHGCMYNIVDRCLHRFVRAES